MDRMLEQPTATRTIVSFLLDRTGWMALTKDATIDGVNTFLDRLERQAGDVVEFTMLQYDSLAIETLYLGAKLTDVRRLTPETYEPRACVPLIDACYATIKAAEETVLRRRDEPRVLVVFLAGGDDDSSCDHTVEELRSLIEGRRAEGWQFIVLGAEFNAYPAARAFGIDEGSTVSYDGLLGCLHSMSATAELAGAFARGQSNRVGFTADQKRAARDRYWEGADDADNITISDEEIERAMRVYTSEEVMGLLQCGAPGWSVSTEVWQEFLVRMRAAPQTRATQCGIAEAERELAHRQSWQDYDSEILEPRRRRVCALLQSFEATQAEAAPRRSWDNEPATSSMTSRSGATTATRNSTGRKASAAGRTSWPRASGCSTSAAAVSVSTGRRGVSGAGGDATTTEGAASEVALFFAPTHREPADQVPTSSCHSERFSASFRRVATTTAWPPVPLT
jgi:hypothetical protein